MLTLTLFNIFPSKYRPIWPPPWPFRFTWRLRSRDHLIICYRCFIVPESVVSQAIFEIMVHKHVGVTTLTFLGHVTLSVTWPIDSPYVISYWRYIGISNGFRDICIQIYLPSGSQSWPFRLTWRHWPCDHLILQVPFPICALLWPSLYL